MTYRFASAFFAPILLACSQAASPPASAPAPAPAPAPSSTSSSATPAASARAAAARARLLALPDDELVYRLTQYGLGLEKERGWEALHAEERAIADASYAFTVASDDGLSWYFEDGSLVPLARRTRDALRAVGLEAHARIFDEILAAYPRGPKTADDKRFDAWDDAWGAQSDRALDVIAAYARAHADAIRWELVDGYVITIRIPGRE